MRAAATRPRMPFLGRVGASRALYLQGSGDMAGLHSRDVSARLSKIAVDAGSRQLVDAPPASHVFCRNATARVGGTAAAVDGAGFKEVAFLRGRSRAPTDRVAALEEADNCLATCA